MNRLSNLQASLEPSANQHNKSKNMPFLQNRDSAIAGNLSELIGGTPMVYLSPKINNTKAKIAQIGRASCRERV
jgi:hypothetical protein